VTSPECGLGKICTEGTCVPASCSDELSCSAWVSEPWGVCHGATCTVSGTRNRAVKCVDQNGAISTGCSAATKPPVAEICSHDVSSCDHRWVTTPYENCKAACGASTKSRTASCVRADNQTVDASRCPQPKPDTVQSCQSTESCTYGWSAGPFGACSNTCGPGMHDRTVTCSRSDGTEVASGLCADTQPAASEACRDCDGCGGCSPMISLRIARRPRSMSSLR